MADLLRRIEHRFCQGNLSSYFDGQLPQRAMERVQRHLEQCQECRQDLEALQHTVALLRGMPRPRPPRSFAIPETVPAPSLPFWMRSGVYATLRMATATVAALFVITVAGSALTMTAFEGARSLRAPELAFGKAAATAPAAAPAAAGAAPAGEALANDTPTAPMLGAAPVTPTPAPQPAQAGEAPRSPAIGEPTLTAEEAARKASAPPGMGEGSPPGATPQPLGTPSGAGETMPAPAPVMPGPGVEPGRGGDAAATPTPAEIARALGVQQGEPTARAGEAMGVDRGQAAATAAADVYRLQRSAARDALQEARLRLSAYPWPALMVAAAVALVLLLGATLWLRSARSRWP